jgi:D-arabinose 1-dehydrogenase-like Zn-dependent alcohol dehydrogenase
MATRKNSRKGRKTTRKNFFGGFADAVMSAANAVIVAPRETPVVEAAPNMPAGGLYGGKRGRKVTRKSRKSRKSRKVNRKVSRKVNRKVSRKVNRKVSRKGRKASRKH